MIKRIYLTTRYLIIVSIAMLLLIIALAAYPASKDYLGKKFLKANGIEYSKIGGSLLNGVSLYDVNYTGSVLIKRLDIKYNLFALFNTQPLIEKVFAKKLQVISQKFPKKNKNSDSATSFSIAITKLLVEESKIVVGDESYDFDLKGSNIKFKDHLDVEIIALQLASSYGEINVKGSISDNELHAQSIVKPKQNILDRYTGFLRPLPSHYAIDVQANLTHVNLGTRLNQLSLNADQNITINHADLHVSYDMDVRTFAIDAHYQLAYDEFKTEVLQKGFIEPSGKYSSEFNATVVSAPIALPFDFFTGRLSNSSGKILAQLDAQSVRFNIKENDNKQFMIEGESKELPLSFISKLPENIKDKNMTIKANAMLSIQPFALKGTFSSKGFDGSIDGNIDFNPEEKQVHATLLPNPKSTLWMGYPIEKFSPINLYYFDGNETEVFHIDANKLNLSLFKVDNSFSGMGTLGSSDVNIVDLRSDTNTTEVIVSTKIPSLHKFLLEFELIGSDETITYDAEVDINATLSLSDALRVKSRIDLPWYFIKPDSRTVYKGKSLFLESSYADKVLRVDRYSTEVARQRIYSQKPSTITFDTKGIVELNEFWIYDNLLVTGSIDPSKMLGTLQMKSDRFTYASQDGNVTFSADINASIESDGQQRIKGKMTVLDGMVTYEPSRDYTISDDIIIIQDIRPLGSLKRFIDIHVDAVKPISYKTKNIDIKFMPDIVLWQEPNTPFKILGMASVEEGTVSGAGKKFSFDKSEIYFNGAHPINPYLNLNLHHHTLDETDIEIFISNTMAAPVVILSSAAGMSQDDIMSYVLFGKPASSNFDTSGEGTSAEAASAFILATGLKQILNDSTGFKVDTLNILTSKEGTLGYEIGTRFNKQIRVVYRNDTISSVIIQYSLSKTIRIDVDAYEKGQGATILYVKDF